MYILVFRWGQGRREIICWMWKQKPLPVIAGKKLRNAVNRAIVRSSKKEVFWDILLDLVCINFRICGISINPGHPSDVLTLVTCRLSDLRKPPTSRGAAAGVSVTIVKWSFWRRQRVISLQYDGAGAWQLPSATEQQSRSHRRKSERYTRYLWNFDGPLGCLVVADNIFDVGNVSSLRKTMARVRDNCRCCHSWSMSPPPAFRGKSTILHVHFAVYLA